MKKLLILLVGISFTMPLAAKKILLKEDCDDLGCNRVYRLTGKDVIPYVEPSEEQKFRQMLEKEIKSYRSTHPGNASLSDKEVAAKMLKEMSKKPWE